MGDKHNPEAIRRIITDLAIEANEFYSSQPEQTVAPVSQKLPESQPQGIPAGETHVSQPGVEVQTSGSTGIKVTRIRITTPEGAKSLGKPMGTYITVEVPGIRNNDQELFENTCKSLAAQLASILRLNDDSTILIVGLGNWNVTPDALGPKVVSKVMVTRHIHEYVPDQVQEGVRPVCAVSPGVLGITGIETGEIVKGIVDRIKPHVVIAIDALASRKLDRVNATIQIADTGISPGSGVGNKRMELTAESLGVPVVAIGVPTVVDAATMANDTIDLVLDSMIKQAGQGSEFYKMLSGIDRNEKYQMIQELLDPYVGNLVVTPKEIDEVVDRIAKVIANALNIALHKGVTMDDVNRYIQ